MKDLKHWLFSSKIMIFLLKIMSVGFVYELIQMNRYIYLKNWLTLLESSHLILLINERAKVNDGIDWDISLLKVQILLNSKIILFFYTGLRFWIIHFWMFNLIFKRFTDFFLNIFKRTLSSAFHHLSFDIIVHPFLIFFL